MASEAAEQVAAPAESSNTQLAPGTNTPIPECGWKGGDRDSACEAQEGRSRYFLSLIGSTPYGCQRTPSRLSASLRPLTRRAERGLDCARWHPKVSNHPVKERKYLTKDLTWPGLLMESPLWKVAEDKCESSVCRWIEGRNRLIVLVYKVAHSRSLQNGFGRNHMRSSPFVLVRFGIRL